MDRNIKFSQSLLEALDLSMAKDPSVYIIGLGVPDPKAVFGTTAGLQEKYGNARVMDMPCSENGMTGIAIGSAIAGMRPILTHQRVDFALLSVEQLVNQAAKWHYMFGGKIAIPLVVRMVIGRGWGQGPQHSQSLQSWFAHIPGLKVVMPTTAYDAKGLLIASIEDDNPVIFFEHRWLHGVTGPVPEGLYRVPIGKARVAREGRDVTIAAFSYMTLEALRAADILAAHGVQAEVIDIRTLRPLDEGTILDSVRKTGRLIVTDTSWKFGGFSSEITALVVEKAFTSLKSFPVRIGLPDYPAPTTPSLIGDFYPTSAQIVTEAWQMLGKSGNPAIHQSVTATPADVPDPGFTGPF